MANLTPGSIRAQGLTWSLCVETEIREAILEGAGIELIPQDNGGWHARVGLLDVVVAGRTAGEVLLRLADIVSTPAGVCVQ